jgi:hypothetical protein
MLFGLGYEGPLKTARDRWPKIRSKIRSKIRLTERVLFVVDFSLRKISFQLLLVIWLTEVV